MRRRDQLDGGHRFPNFEMLDAKIASAKKKIITNPYFKGRISLEEQKVQMQDRFLHERQAAYMIHEYFRVTGHMMLLLIIRICSYHFYMATISRIFTLDGTRIRHQQVKFQMTRFRKVCTKMRMRESDQLQTLLALNEKDIAQDRSRPSYQKLKTMVKRHQDQRIRTKKNKPLMKELRQEYWLRLKKREECQR